MQITHSTNRQVGMSLIEILIGLGIGMLAIIIIMQSLTIWDAQRRSTTSGSDAQINGSIAMYELDRDIKLAGLGFGSATAPVLNCSVEAFNSARGSDFTFKLLPVEITSDAGGQDQIAVLYGNSKQLVTDITFSASTASSKQALRQGGFFIGDVTLVTRETGAMECDLIAISGNTNVDGRTVDHVGGPWNRTGGTVATYTSGLLFNLGSKPHRRVWRIRNNSLEFYEDLTTPTAARDANAQQVAEQIINMKAQYGISTGGAITSWTVTPPTDWTTVRAIRVGVLARSRQYERVLKADGTCCIDVTTAVPGWSGTGAGTSDDAPFVLKNLDGTDGASAPAADPDNWKRYRYRVYESLIPLRNVVWGVGTP